MNEIEDAVNAVVMDVTKAVLHSKELASFHTEPAKMYMFLSKYFQQAAEQEAHETSIAITQGCAKKLLVFLEKSITTTEAAHHRMRTAVGHSGENDVGAILSTSSGPFLSHRIIREKLAALKINNTAFAEVVDVCRYLDQVQGVTVPFGAVNLWHFVVVYITLCRVDSLFDLIALVIEFFSGGCKFTTNDAIKFFHLWATIDATNRSAFEALINLLLSHPGLNVALLLELFPGIRYINTPQYQPPAPADRSGVIVSHNPDDEEANGNASNEGNSSPKVGAAVDDDQDTSSTDAEAEAELDEHVDREFWTQLVS